MSYLSVWKKISFLKNIFLVRNSKVAVIIFIFSPPKTLIHWLLVPIAATEKSAISLIAAQLKVISFSSCYLKNVLFVFGFLYFSSKAPRCDVLYLSCFLLHSLNWGMKLGLMIFIKFWKILTQSTFKSCFLTFLCHFFFLNLIKHSRNPHIYSLFLIFLFVFSLLYVCFSMLHF